MIIDFPPGALGFHGRDHGVRLEEVVDAFASNGWTVGEQDADWGGGMFMVSFERR